MSDRKKHNSSSREKNTSSTSSGNAPQRKSTFFINGEGIDREVITTDICRYLGNDALVKPGNHIDQSGRAHDGFYITAYRPPTTEQLNDLRNDSRKWREERQNSARPPPGGYPTSATQRDRQDALRGDNKIDEPRSGTSGYAPSGYGPMAPPPPPAPQRSVDYTPEYASVHAYRNASTGATQPPLASGAYPTPKSYLPPETPNYVYGGGSSQMGYGAPDDRNRIDPTQSQPWNMQPGYAPTTVPPTGTNYPARSGFGYPSAVSNNSAIPPGYRVDSGQNYDYPPRDSGLAPTEQPVYEYDNDEDMEFDDSPASAVPAHPPNRRDRDRDSRERHDDSRRKGHRT